MRRVDIPPLLVLLVVAVGVVSAARAAGVVRGSGRDSLCAARMSAMKLSFLRATESKGLLFDVALAGSGEEDEEDKDEERREDSGLLMKVGTGGDSEARLGLLLNKLNSPTFVTTHAVFECPASQLPKVPLTQVRSHSDVDLDSYMLLEKVAPGTDLTSFLSGPASVRLVNQLESACLGMFRSLFIQIYAALYDAQTRFEFTHYDLHTSNVVLRKVSADPDDRWDYSIIEPETGPHQKFSVPASATDFHQFVILDFGIARAHDPASGETIESSDQGPKGFHPVFDARWFAIQVMGVMSPDLVDAIHENAPPKDLENFKEWMRNLVNFSEGTDLDILKWLCPKYHHHRRHNHFRSSHLSKRSTLERRSPYSNTEPQLPKEQSIAHLYRTESNHVDFIPEILEESRFMDLFRL